MQKCEKSNFRYPWAILLGIEMAYVVIVIHIRGTRDKAGPYLLSVNLTIEIWSLIAKKRKKSLAVYRSLA